MLKEMDAVHSDPGDGSSRFTRLIMFILYFALLGGFLLAATFGDSSEQTWLFYTQLASGLFLGLLFVVLAGGRPYSGELGHNDRNEMFCRLPSWTQRGLTLLAGKPHEGQKPLWQKTWKWHLFTAVAKVAVGAALGMGLVVLMFDMPMMMLLPQTWVGLALAWLLTVGGARASLVTVTHQVIHGQFSGSPALDAWIADLIGSFLLLQDRESYEKDHRGTHHLFRFMATGSDPDAALLRELGFLPGMTPKQLWGQLWKTCLSPMRFHGRFLKARLEANFWSPETPLKRRLFAWGFHVAMLLGVAVCCWMWSSAAPALAFALAWLLPMTVLYQVSALFQFVCEHYWETDRCPREHTLFASNKKAVIAKLTNGRFMADPVPPQDLTGWTWAWAWTWWWARLMVVHLPCRIAVVCSDLPAHDWHHRHEASAEWVDGLYARQRDIEAGCPGWELPYSEVWGLGNAIDRVFEAMAALEPAESEKKKNESLELRTAFLGM